MVNNKILDKVERCVQNQNTWRETKTINLIASENHISRTAERFSISDFSHRYAEGLVNQREYQGQKYQDEIEKIAITSVKNLFKSKYADVRCPTATIANISIYYGCCKSGNIMFSLSVPNGAHISMRKFGGAGLRGLKIYDIPFDFDNYTIDMDLFGNLILGLKPRIITLGASVFLFPHPVQEIKKICEDLDTIIHYDGSHVLGLIAGGEFQDPLGEGADILMGSTHKTFPGPQGAIICTNKREILTHVEKGIFPGTVSNHHMHRLPPLAITCEEMANFGEEYAQQIVKNAKAFARYLYLKGFDVMGKKNGYTKSHQIVINLSEHGKGLKNAILLEQADIITNKNLIHGDEVNSVNDPSGLRLGVQEMTRFGMKQDDFAVVADFFERVIMNDESPSRVREDVNEFRSKFLKIFYSFD